MKIIPFFLLLVSATSVAFSAWTPRPNFSIEGSDYKSTLTFVSGMGYALTAVADELDRSGNGRFICNAPKVIGSQVLLEILNSRVSGSISSEKAIATVMEGLKEKYPCR